LRSIGLGGMGLGNSGGAGQTFARAGRLRKGMKKTLLALCVVSLAAGSAHAQLFRPTVVEGALLGGAAGAIIGHNSDHRTGEGAAIGALAGALIGSALDDHYEAPRPVVVSPPPPVVVAPPQQVVYVYEAPACPPPPPAPVVVYYPRTVTVYSSGYACPPPRRVVYVNGWGPSWSCTPQYEHRRWR